MADAYMLLQHWVRNLKMLAMLGVHGYAVYQLISVGEVLNVELVLQAVWHFGLAKGEVTFEMTEKLGRLSELERSYDCLEGQLKRHEAISFALRASFDRLLASHVK